MTGDEQRPDERGGPDESDGLGRLDDRTAELIAGALADDLDENEQAELAAIVGADPTVGAELEELGGTVDHLRRDVPVWREATPSADLRARVLRVGAPDEAEDEPEATPALAPAPAPVRARERARAPRRRAFWAPAACFVGGVLVTAGGFVVAPGLQGGPPEGPPGTLGAVEDLALDSGPGAVDGARIDASLVAHTWGTETVLEIDGLPAGEGYDVVLIGPDGQEYDSGSFLASAVTIDCRMNAAVMRADVERLEIRQEGGAVVTAATLPDAVDDRG